MDSESQDGVLQALGILALAAAAFYSPLILGVRTFPDGDFTHHFLPFSEYLAEAWRQTRLPLWNPYTYSGHPFLADVQAAVFYPVSTLVLLLTLPITSSGGRLFALEIDAVLHVILAGFFTYLLARELTRKFWASLLAGAAFMLSGYLTGYPPLQLAVLRSAVWLPLLLWLFLRGWEEPYRWRYWLVASWAYAVAFFAGHTQTWLFLTYATAGWLVMLTLATWASRPGDFRHAVVPQGVGVIMFAAVAVGLMAVQLLPSVEFARLTVRSSVSYEYLSDGFPVRDTWQLLLPGVLTHYSPLYVGIVAFGMAIFGVAAGIGRPSELGVEYGSDTSALSVKVSRYALVYFVAAGLFALLVSYGENAFLYPILHKFAPGWDLFRGQERAAYIVAFALSMLAGRGLACVPAASPKWRKRYAFIFGALVTAAVYVFGLLWQLPGRTAVSQWQYISITIVTLALAMTVSLTFWVDGWSRRRDWLICGLAVINLFWANGSTNLVNRTPQQAVIMSPELTALGDAVATAGDDTTGMEPRAYNEFRVYEDYGMQAQIEDTWGSSPLRLSRYAALFDDFPLDRMFRLTGVEYLLTWRKDLFEPSLRLREFPQQKDTTYLHQLVEPNPRAWVVPSIVSEDDGRARELLADHDFDLEHAAVVPTEAGLGDWSGGSQGAAVAITRTSPQRIHFDITDSGAGILSVSENWMPGWRVETVTCSKPEFCGQADHESGLPLLTPVRANLSFLAIALPEGDVSFDLVYAPDSLRIGAFVTFSTLMVVAVAATLRRFRKRHPGIV